MHKLEALREHKPPPIRRIRISDFGLPDPKRDPDRHQNCITWSLSHALLLWISPCLPSGAKHNNGLGVPLTEGQGRGIREKGMLG